MSAGSNIQNALGRFDIFLKFPSAVTSGTSATPNIYLILFSPDILTVAKALGCGVPVGAFLAKEEVAKALVPGDHGTTYGGNPLACAAATKVFELFEKQHILDNVKEVSAYLEEKLDELVAEYDFIIERRGLGLMQGLELSINPKDVIANALDNGLILFSAGTNVIRMVPPLVITKADVDEMITKLKKSF